MNGTSGGDRALDSEFREALKSLAEQARGEQMRAAKQASKYSEPQTGSWWIVIGLAMIGAQALLALTLYSRQAQALTARRDVPVLRQNDCNHTVYKTYWGIVAYLHDHHHTPGKLDDLLGRYVEKLPVDPTTGRSLEYSTNGSRFELRCTGSVRPATQFASRS